MKVMQDLPPWMDLVLKHLKDGMNADIWRDCLNAWEAFEKENGLLDVSSVSEQRNELTCINQTISASSGNKGPASNPVQMADETEV